MTGPICFYMHSLQCGGAERAVLSLAGEMKRRGYDSRILINYEDMTLAGEVPENVPVERVRPVFRQLGFLSTLMRRPCLPVTLKQRRPTPAFKFVPGLRRALARIRPAVVFSSLHGCNEAAVIAARLLRPPPSVVPIIHAALSPEIRANDNLSARLAAMAPLYAAADHIVCVSKGVRDDLRELVPLPPDRVSTIYNPFPIDTIRALALEDPHHPWLAEARPVILGVGRLAEQKNFALLIDAFARVRQHCDARLILLGEGPLRSALAEQTVRLGVAEDVDLVGLVGNPYAYMARARLVVVSSRYEGFSRVLVEAMACGCPVVSTDCPSGPREVLDGGRFGRLVSVNEPDAMAKAIVETLDSDIYLESLVSRAQEYASEKVGDQYEALIDRLASVSGQPGPKKTQLYGGP